MTDGDVDLAIGDIAFMARSERATGPEFEMVRVGGFRSALELLAELGHDPEPVLRACGLSLETLRDPEGVAPLSNVLGLFVACVRTSRLPHFGLLAGARNGLPTLGLFGHLAQTAPDVRTGLEDLIGFLFVHDRFARARLRANAETAALDYIFDYRSADGADEGVDFVVAAVTKMVRGLCGEEWNPTLVRLPRRPPPNGLPYREMFRTGVNFGADYGSIEFPARWLDRPLPGSNESLRFYLLDLVRQARQASDSEAERVRRIIRTQLVGGRPNARRAAALMGVHRRTLARRLSAESLSFKQLTQDLRFEMAREMLSKSNAPMARIAELLGYSDQTVFSRAFSNRFGYPPSRLRAQQHARG
jgi:AraC-like DNA-binding protein